MKKFTLVFAAIIILFCNTIKAQDTTALKNNTTSRGSDYNFWDHIFTGGGVIFTIGNDVTALGAQPMIGYRVTDNFSVGLSGNYIYYRVNYGGGIIYKTNIYGASAFARHTIFDKVFAHVEPGFTNWEVPTFDPKTQLVLPKRQSVPFLYLGGGYSQELGDNASLEILVLYDVLYDNLKSFSGSPLIFRAGFNIGL